jgi:sulfotransferase family protein
VNATAEDIGSLYEGLERDLERREGYYPARKEPEWSALQELLATVTDRLWAGAADEPARRPAPELEQLAEQPVFVLGYYKSGTSLLLNLLDGHPELLALPGESRHFTSGAPRDLQALHALWIRNTITPYGIPPRWLLGTPGDASDPYDDFGRRLVAYARARGDRDLLAAVAQALAVTMQSTARMWVEKTPTNEFHVDTMLAAYPGARFVHIVRDPRSTIGSIRNYGAETPIVDPLTGAAELARSFRVALAEQRRLGDRYTVVRYEDLVADPAATMRHVASQLGIACEDTLVAPTSFGRPATANAGRRDRRVSGEVHTLSVNGGSGLNRRDHATVEALAGREAQELGYDTGTGSRVVALAARAALAIRYRTARR